MICAHFACDMHCISDARMRSKLGYKQASLLSYHGVCDRRNRCLICIECCVCDCVLSSLSLSLSWCMQQKKQMRILHRMWLLHSDILLCHLLWTVNEHSSSSSSSSFHAETIESVRGQSLDLMSLRLRNKELKSTYVYTYIYIYTCIYIYILICPPYRHKTHICSSLSASRVYVCIMSLRL